MAGFRKAGAIAKKKSSGTKRKSGGNEGPRSSGSSKRTNAPAAATSAQGQASDASDGEGGHDAGRVASTFGAKTDDDASITDAGLRKQVRQNHPIIVSRNQ